MRWASATGGLLLTASNVNHSNGGFSHCGNPGVTGTPGLTVQYGSGSYTYAWTQVGTPAQSGPYNCSNAAIANPTWSKASVCDGDTPNSETWRVTVTDTVSGAQKTKDIIVTLIWSDFT